jgi:hypothetical protein
MGIANDSMFSLTVGESVLEMADTEEWTASVAARTSRLVMQSSQPVRIRWDGGDPTSTTGFRLAAHQVFSVTETNNCDRLKLVLDADATENATVCFQPEAGEVFRV